MLKKDFHHTIVGSNYLSLILAIDWVQSGKDVLVLDDQRMQLGDLFGNDLGLLELLYLKCWGDERHIGCLSMIESYAQNRPFVIIGDDVWLRLGNRPSENWHEFSRRFNTKGQVLDEEFDQAWLQFVTRVSQAYFRYGGYQQITPDKLLVYAPPSIKELYQSFHAFMKEPRSWKSEALIRAAMSYFSKRIDGNIDDGDIFFLFVSLFSPRFLLSEEKLVAELLNTYTALKGDFKETQMREWLFHRQKPWSVELSSYEGIIHPKHLTFVGAYPHGMPFGLEPINEHFVTLRAKCKAHDWLSADSLPFSIVTSDHWLGTRSPFWLVEANEGELIFQFLVPARPGMKLSFLENEILAKIRESIPLILPHMDVIELGHVEMELTPELFVVGKKGQKALGTIQSVSQVGIYDTSRPGQKAKLKNVEYFGPLRVPKMGLFSSLVDLTIETQFTV